MVKKSVRILFGKVPPWSSFCDLSVDTRDPPVPCWVGIFLPWQFLLPPFGPTRNLRCTCLGRSIPSSFCIRPCPPVDKNRLDVSNLVDPFLARSPPFVGSISRHDPFLCWDMNPYSSSPFSTNHGPKVFSSQRLVSAKLAGKDKFSCEKESPTSHLSLPLTFACSGS